jgi:hypothetical protein
VTSLIRTSGQGIITRDGQVVDLESAEYDDVAHFRAMIDEAESTLKAIRADVDQRLMHDMRERGSLTYHGGSFDLAGKLRSDRIPDHQAKILRGRLLEEGVAQDRVDELCPEVVVVKAKPGGLRKLASLTPNEGVRNVITAYLPGEESRRYIEVKRA